MEVVPAKDAAPLSAQLEALRREVERLRHLSSQDRGLLEALLRHSPHGILVCDAQGRLVLHNEAAERIWAGSATADTVADWGHYRAFHADGRPYEGADWSMARCLASGAVVHAEEVRVQRFDGTFGVLLGSCAPIYGDDGALTGAVAVFADISELKEIEASQRRLLQVTEALNRAADLGQVYGTALEAICALLGVERAAIITADEAGHLAYTAWRGLSDAYRATLEGRQAAGDRLPPDVSIIPDVRLSPGTAPLLPLLQAEGIGAIVSLPLHHGERLLGRLSIYFPAPRTLTEREQDLTRAVGSLVAQALERARLLELERAARRAAEETARAREHVLAVVSHDLRNPLGLIDMTARALAEQGGADPRQVERILRAVGQMDRLIQDLLDLESVQAGRLAVAPRPEAPADLVAAALQLHGPVAARRGVQVDVQIEAALPQVAADRQRVLQVLDNLLGNALKVMPGGGALRVRAARVGGEVQIAIADTGPGLRPEDLARLFERYFRGSSATYPGTGLGLSIARGLVEAHGGRIWAEGSPGQGCTFTFTLPVATAAPEQPARRQ